MVGIRSASMVLPAPGWPSGSARSGPGGEAGTAGGSSPPMYCVAGGPPRKPGVPRSQSAAAVRLLAAITRMPGTSAAWGAFCSATITVSNLPLPAAAATASSTPRTDRSRPSRPSSPKKITPSDAVLGTVPAAVSTPTAIARANIDE